MSIFQTIVDKYKDSRQKSFNKKEFKALFLKAVNDGKLTADEIKELEQRKSELGLSDEDIKGIKSEVYLAAFASAKSDTQVTSAEEQELIGIQKYLGLADSQIGPTKKELARLRLLNEIQMGNMPSIPSVANLVLQKGEKIYWFESATLAEEKVIKRNYRGGSSGVSFRIMKGVSYRVGSSRGHIESTTGIVAVSEGDVLISNKRLIFRGDKKSFASKLENILDIQLFTNGVHFSENNKSKPRLIQFSHPGNQDIFGAILSYAINHYGEKTA